MTKNKFLIVGMGAISSKHIEGIKAAGGVIKYSCDIDPEKYPDYKSFMDVPVDVDYVVIATPHGTHYEIAKHFLEISKRPKVIIEKPCVLSTFHYRYLHPYHNRIIPVLQNQLNPEYIAVKKQINENMETIIGCRVSVLWNRPDSYFKSSRWRGSETHKDNVIFNQAIHLIHAAVSLFKPNFNEFVTNYCFKRNNRPKVMNTFSECEFRIENTRGNFIQCSASLDIPMKNIETKLTIITDANTYTVDYTGNTNNYPGGYSGSLSLHSALYYDIIHNDGQNLDKYDDAFASVNICERITKLF